MPWKPITIKSKDHYVSMKNLHDLVYFTFTIPGSICLVVGLLIAAVDLAWPHRFSTVLEVDYDTPYDRHVLIVDSRQRARPQTQSSLPSRILRYHGFTNFIMFGERVDVFSSAKFP